MSFNDLYSIAVAPTIVSSSKSEMMVSAGGTVTLFCEASSDTPVTFEWSKNGQKLTSNGKQQEIFLSLNYSISL